MLTDGAIIVGRFTTECGGCHMPVQPDDDRCAYCDVGFTHITAHPYSGMTPHLAELRPDLEVVAPA